eukprot:350352-Chlamydomonas_euryale.AAC.5
MPGPREPAAAAQSEHAGCRGCGRFFGRSKSDAVSDAPTPPSRSRNEMAAPPRGRQSPLRPGHRSFHRRCRRVPSRCAAHTFNGDDGNDARSHLRRRRVRGAACGDVCQHRGSCTQPTR